MWFERYPYIQQQTVLPDTISTAAFQFHEINLTNNLTHIPAKEEMIWEINIPYHYKMVINNDYERFFLFASSFW